MIRNVRLKKALVNISWPPLSLVNRMARKREQVFFYNANDTLRDNSEALFRYMIAQGINRRLPIVTNLPESERQGLPQAENVRYISKKDAVRTYMESRYVFYSFGKLPIVPAKDQCVINLWHGIPLKTIANLSKVGNGREFFFTYVIASSELYRPIIAKAFGCPEKNVVIAGEPKTDPMYGPAADRSSKADESPARGIAQGQNEGSGSAVSGGSRPRYIVWAPTFRQSGYFGYADSSDRDLLPMLPESSWEEFNSFLEEVNVHILVKLHGGQDLHGFTQKVMSHFEIYSDQAFRDKGMNLYAELAKSDALLADYSSVYLEYLALNRPIGFVIEDMKEYQDRRGFVFDDPLAYMPGDKIRDLDGLKDFIRQTAAGEDPWMDVRTRVGRQVNQYREGGNCRRILEIAGIL